MDNEEHILLVRSPIIETILLRSLGGLRLFCLVHFTFTFYFWIWIRIWIRRRCRCCCNRSRTVSWLKIFVLEACKDCTVHRVGTKNPTQKTTWNVCFFFAIFHCKSPSWLPKFDLEYFKALLKYESCVFIAVYFDKIERKKEEKKSRKNPIKSRKNL